MLWVQVRSAQKPETLRWKKDPTCSTFINVPGVLLPKLKYSFETYKYENVNTLEKWEIVMIHIMKTVHLFCFFSHVQ